MLFLVHPTQTEIHRETEKQSNRERDEKKRQTTDFSVCWLLGPLIKLLFGRLIRGISFSALRL